METVGAGVGWGWPRVVVVDVVGTLVGVYVPVGVYVGSYVKVVGA